MVVAWLTIDGMGPAYATGTRPSGAVDTMRGWASRLAGCEIGDRVFVRRYAFYDQNIGVVLGDGEALVIDTRSHARPGAGDRRATCGS